MDWNFECYTIAMCQFFQTRLRFGMNSDFANSLLSTPDMASMMVIGICGEFWNSSYFDIVDQL